MPDLPLLLFPQPVIADRSAGHGFRPSVHRPTHEQQGRRLTPIFEQLEASYNERQVEIQSTAAGADPEQILVIETIGNVENFANAARRVEGLEWIGEVEIDDIVPDEAFYDENNRGRLLNGRLYLVMSNQSALHRILSIWDRYKNNENMSFDRGFAKFRDVFRYLKNIRRWDTQDRLDETGILEAWQKDLEHDGERRIRCEIELWYRGTNTKRRQAKAQIETLMEDCDGSILDECTISEIAYHALLVEIPANAARQIIDHSNISLIRCESVMFFHPVGQMVTGDSTVEGDLLDHESEETGLPTGQPIIALLDGLPLANHELLQRRLIIDDPDNYSSTYAVSDRVHGTEMASLIVHGDLNDGLRPLSRLIYVRPIMKPIPWYDSPCPEKIPDDILTVDLIHRAVRRMFEGEGSSEAIASTVCIINFSIGDPSRQFTSSLSPWARLLDWLSVKYGVLFIISAGNHTQNIETGIPSATFNGLSDAQKEAEIVKCLYANTRHRKLLSPGESINGITVGALHHDSAIVNNIGYAVDLLTNLLPSPVSAFGGGHRRSVKPDILFNGGRLLYKELLGAGPHAIFEARKERVAPGNKVASPSNMAGELSKVVHCCGTSNAAALTSRMAAICHDALLDVFREQAPDFEFRLFLAPMLKAMIIHGCSWGEIRERLQGILGAVGDNRQIRNWISQWLGYGVPDANRVLECTEQRATLLGFGQLSDGEAHLFNLPLPSSLSARRELRRLTVTLAWISPVAPSTQRYRSAGLWFEMESNIAFETRRQDIDHNSSRRGTVQHEIFEGIRAVPIADDASLTIKVNCRKDAAKIGSPVAYGLAVTLEVAENVDINVYEEIRTRIAPAVAIRTTGST